MSAKRMDVRRMQRTSKSRIRFYDVFDDQLPQIRAALDKARDEMETDHDSQALEMICVHYLANG